MDIGQIHVKSWQQIPQKVPEPWLVCTSSPLGSQVYVCFHDIYDLYWMGIGFLLNECIDMFKGL